MKDFFPSPQLTPVIFFFFKQPGQSPTICALRGVWQAQSCEVKCCEVENIVYRRGATRRRRFRPTGNITSARLLSSKTRASLFSSLFTCKEDVKHSFAIWAACTFGFHMAAVIKACFNRELENCEINPVYVGFLKFLSSLTVCLYAVAVFFCSARIHTRRKDDEICKSRAAFGASRFSIQQCNILTLRKTLIRVICWTARSYPVPGSTFYPVIWCARVWTSCLWLWIIKGKQHGSNWTPELNQEAVEWCLPVAFVEKGRTDPKVFLNACVAARATFTSCRQMKCFGLQGTWRRGRRRNRCSFKTLVQ